MRGCRCLCTSAPLKLMIRLNLNKSNEVLSCGERGNLRTWKKNFLENQLNQPIIIMQPFEFLILSTGRINKDLSAKSFLLDCSAKKHFLSQIILFPCRDRCTTIL